MALGKVVIVGKPNVGKSQLFNRLTGERHSVVYSEPGITRDRVALEVDWFGKRFILVDTGGYTQDELSFQEEINRQTEIALAEADLVLFVTSVKEGITEEDIYLAKTLKKKRVGNILVVANKCDLGGEWGGEAGVLGFGEALLISAEHGINTGELLERIVGRLKFGEVEKEEERYGISIIGRPNVGKSSLVNALLGEERVITSDVAGTTRDAIDLDFDYLGKKYRLIDTPGIRRHASIQRDEADRFSLLRAQKSLQRADMVWLVLDVDDGINELDERVGGLVWKANIPSVIVVNKCDLLENVESGRKEFEREIRNRFRFLTWSPIVFVSAKTGRKLGDIFRKMDAIKEEIGKRVSPQLLHEFLHKISFLYSVPTVKGKKIKLFSLVQTEGQVPTFLFLCNDPKYLHFSYSRLVERRIRSCFGYKICPITVIYKKK